MDKMIHINGSMGEGGGQIFRTAIGLSAAMRKDVQITNIRSGRDKPGLRPQHLAAVRAAAQICDAELTGDEIESQAVTFRPGRCKAGKYHFDIGTAGSTALLVQTIIPALMQADGDSDVVVTGGTHVPMAPCFEYLRDVYSVLASAANLQAYFDLDRAGFYPGGGGRIKMMVRGLGGPENIEPLRLTQRGELKYVEGVSASSSSLADDIAERQAIQVLGRLASDGYRPSIEQATLDSHSPGTVVFVRAVFSRTVAGFFALGRRGLRANQVADQAVDALLAFVKSAGVIDSYAADQLLVLAAQGPCESRFITESVTSHLKTNAAVVEKITGRKVRIETSPDKSALVTVSEDKRQGNRQ